MTRPAAFATVRTEGSLLPVDLLQRLAASDSRLPGLDPADYHLEANDRLNAQSDESGQRFRLKVDRSRSEATRCDSLGW